MAVCRICYRRHSSRRRGSRMDLKTFMSTAFQGSEFQTINQMFREKDALPTQKFSKVMLTTLDKLVNKELDRNAFCHVSVLLQCIQEFCKYDVQESLSLIQQGLVPKMVLWFERTVEFLDATELAANENLPVLIEHFYDTSVVICKCNNEEGKEQLLDLYVLRLGILATQPNRDHHLRLEALRTLNSILCLVPREERHSFYSSEEMHNLTKDLAKAILQAGDYEIQVGISEALCRMVRKKSRDILVHTWFSESLFAEAFSEIDSLEFETDCRKFLNKLNTGLGDTKSVYTFPCKTVFADLDELKKPVDRKLEEFWIDFNTGSHSVTFYIDNITGSLWDTVRLVKDAINVYSLKEGDNHKILSINLKAALSINRKMITKIQIYFESKFDIQDAARMAFGDEKMSEITSEIKTEPFESIAVEEKKLKNALATCESTYLEWKKNQLDKDQTDSASDILSSQLSDTSLAVLISSGTTSTQKSQLTNGSQEIIADSAPESIQDVYLDPALVVSDEACEQPIDVSPVIGIVHEQASKHSMPERSKKRKSSSEIHAEEANEEPIDRSPSIEIVHEQASKNGMPEKSKKRKSSSEKRAEDANEQPTDVSPISEVMFADEPKDGSSESTKRRSISEKNTSESNEQPTDVSPISEVIFDDEPKDGSHESTKKRRSSSEKNTSESKKKSTYDFPPLLNSPSNEMVSEAKRRVLGLTGSAQRDNENSNLNDTLTSTEKRVPSNYREHLFSSNTDGTASNPSEKSWILEQKKKLTPLSDYTRKRPRTRSQLKVLPLSSPSSGEVRQSKKTGSFSKSTPFPKPQLRRGEGKATKLRFSGVQLEGISSILTPGDSCVKLPEKNHHSDDLEAKEDLMYVSGGSSPSYSDIFDDVTKSRSVGTSPAPLRSGFARREEVSKCKRDLPGESSTKSTVSDEMQNAQSPQMSFQPRKLFNTNEKENCIQEDYSKGKLGTVTLSGDEMQNAQSPQISFEPRKLFDSNKKGKNIQEGDSLAELDEVLHAEIQEEEFGNSSVISAFENFSKELKQKFWSRYKRIQIRAQKTLKASEHHVSTLLKQVHQCRLNKLDNFHKIVVQELANLEKETEVLKGLEKTTVDFWKEQSQKLHSFCDSQQERLKSIDSRLEDTIKSFTGVLQETENVEHQMDTVEENTQ